MTNISEVSSATNNEWENKQLFQKSCTHPWAECFEIDTWWARLCVQLPLSCGLFSSVRLGLTAVQRGQLLSWPCPFTIPWTSRTWIGILLSRFENFSLVILPKMFSVPLAWSSSSPMSMIYRFDLSMVSQVSPMPCFVFYLLFSMTEWSNPCPLSPGLTAWAAHKPCCQRGFY